MHERNKNKNTLATKTADESNQRWFESAAGPAILLTPPSSGHLTDLYQDHLPVVPYRPLWAFSDLVLLCNAHMIITVLDYWAIFLSLSLYSLLLNIA